MDLFNHGEYARRRASRDQQSAVSAIRLTECRIHRVSFAHTAAFVLKPCLHIEYDAESSTLDFFLRVILRGIQRNTFQKTHQIVRVAGSREVLYVG